MACVLELGPRRLRGERWLSTAVVAVSLACGDGQRPRAGFAGTDGVQPAATCLEGSCRARPTSVDAGAEAPAAWRAGSLAALPRAARAAALREPCASGADCQLDTRCVAPTSGSCGHDKCTVGAALSQACDPCVAEICAADPACCVEPPFLSGSCAHDVCVTGAPLDPSCDACASTICAQRPECCSAGWDASCASDVARLCGNTCECRPGELADGGRCYAPGEADTTWDDARARCQALGAGWDLVSIADVAEDGLASRVRPAGRSVWLGLRAEGDDASRWTWSSGAPAGVFEPAVAAASTPSIAVARGAEWAYWAGSDAPGELWAALDYDDSAWPRGAAELGFGERDQATVVPGELATYYFRRRFTSAESARAALLDVRFDDGFVAYLNGTEVLRRNVADESHGAFATGNADNAEVSARIDPRLVRAGDNVLAVLVKNAGASSLDLSFDAELELTPTGSALYQAFESGEPSEGDGCAVYAADAERWRGAGCAELAAPLCEGPASAMRQRGPLPSAGRHAALEYGASFRFLDAAVPAADWFSPGYDDAGWSVGVAPFGAGAAAATALSESPARHYFRAAVELPAVSGAALHVLHDDGFVAYVNGVEVGRRDVESSAPADAAERRARLELDPGVLRVGSNVIAVRVENTDGLAPVAFDSRLEVNACGPDGCAPRAWSEQCIARVRTLCDAECAPRAAVAGRCVPWFGAERDASCAGVELSVGVPCDDIVPVCNRGNTPAPAGLRLVHLPADAQGYGGCAPHVDADVGQCFTDRPIAPGACLEVACAGLSPGRPLLINPEGAGHVAECHCDDNWSVYHPGACNAPVCGVSVGVARNAEDATGAALCTLELELARDADLEQSRLYSTASGSELAVALPRVADPGACAGAGYRVTGGGIELCAETCQSLSASPAARLEAEVACGEPAEAAPLVAVERYASGCARDTRTQWGFFTYSAATPGDSSIELALRSAPTVAELAAAPWLPLATASAALGTERCGFAGPPPCPIDLYVTLGGPPRAYDALAELQVTRRPSSEGALPSLEDFQIDYSCVQ